MRIAYDLRKIQVDFEYSKPARWDMANRPVSGLEYVYRVVDKNYRDRNEWQFAVRVPYARSRDQNIQIQPVREPPRLIWEKLRFRVITFVPATNGIHAGKVYCKIFMHDPKGYRTKIGTRRGQRDAFPAWMGPLRHRMRLKATVKDTMGTDGRSQVIVLKRDDHDRMIWIFFATKVWVQKEGYQIE